MFFWWFVSSRLVYLAYSAYSAYSSSSHLSSEFYSISFRPSDSQIAAAVTINERGHIVNGNMTEC